MTFQCEKFDDVFLEMQPLLQEHYFEVGNFKDIPIEVNVTTYRLLEDNGSFKIFTARSDNGDLLGYAGFFIKSHLHHMKSLQAVQDVIFIKKDKRGFGRDFLNWCDVQLKKMGIQVTHQFVTVKHEWGSTLESLGYQPIERVYAKRLDLWDHLVD